MSPKLRQSNVGHVGDTALGRKTCISTLTAIRPCGNQQTPAERFHRFTSLIVSRGPDSSSHQKAPNQPYFDVQRGVLALVPTDSQNLDMDQDADAEHGETGCERKLTGRLEPIRVRCQ